ncbi:Wadjet anti-phage system protein JetD domain-containing protein [Lacinutrix salivirga]
MISPSEIKKKAERNFKRYLSSLIEEINFFPLEISGNKRPNKNIAVFQKEITALVNGSKEKKGYGYTVEYKRVNTRVSATQDLPQKIYFDTSQDYLKFITKEKEVTQFKIDSSMLLNEFPELRNFVINKPLRIVKKAGNWKGIIKVLNYFVANPKPNLYIRELPIKIHTKFIERNKGILRELLDLILSYEAINDKEKFELRFGLKLAEPMIRFKVLDKSLADEHFAGLDDLALPLNLFRNLNLKLSRVVILENKVSMYNALTIPNRTNTIAIFGKGYSVSNIKNIDWLKETSIIYWGDFDAHGFDILSQIREFYDNVQSILMDRETFEKFYEGERGKYLSKEELPNLLKEEQYLYKYIRDNNLRLEQEKIPRDYFIEAFNKL